MRYADRCTLFAEGLLSSEAMDMCWREGVFYNPATCTPEEIQTIKDYAAKYGLCSMEMKYFITKVFYRQAWLNRHMPEPKLILGHNTPFDVGSMAQHTGKGRDPKLYGALSMGLCNWRRIDNELKGTFGACPYHPNIKIKTLAAGKHIIKCGMKYDGLDRWGKPKYADMCLEFLDTRTLARALLGPGEGSLKSLCRMLGTKSQKRENDGHGETIDETYLGYARNDVQCTWELFVKLRDLYKRHNLKRRITHIYSEASIGKGYYEEVGIQSFFGYNHRLRANIRNLDFNLKDVGIAMEGYYGGRSEAQIRHLIMECMHADFRSRYPSANALMKLQDLLLALKVTVDRGVGTQAKRFLDTVELQDFQRKDTWLKLRGFARIRPGDNILPFRCELTPTTKSLSV